MKPVDKNVKKILVKWVLLVIILELIRGVVFRVYDLESLQGIGLIINIIFWVILLVVGFKIVRQIRSRR